MAPKRMVALSHKAWLCSYVFSFINKYPKTHKDLLACGYSLVGFMLLGVDLETSDFVI